MQHRSRAIQIDYHHMLTLHMFQNTHVTKFAQMPDACNLVIDST